MPFSSCRSDHQAVQQMRLRPEVTQSTGVRKVCSKAVNKRRVGTPTPTLSGHYYQDGKAD